MRQDAYLRHRDRCAQLPPYRPTIDQCTRPISLKAPLTNRFHCDTSVVRGTSLINQILCLVCIISLLVPQYGNAQPGVEANAARPLRLIVLIVIDQFPAGYIERFAPFFSAGLHQLIANGAVFENGSHDHAMTETCPGHATIATGQFPSHHGIISNYWFDRSLNQRRYCVQDPENGVSALTLQTPTLADHLRKHQPNSRIVSVSGKDRAAILLGGRTPDVATWFSDKSLSFTSSPFYEKQSAVQRAAIAPFSESFFRQRYRHAQWNKSALPKKLLNRAAIYPFPSFSSSTAPLFSPLHGVPPPLPVIGDRFLISPFVDDLTGLVAEEIAQRLGLGLAGHTDLLLVSFSGIDHIGHRFGPNSRQILETLIQLDKTIGRLLTTMEKLTGHDHLTVVLTSDHGVQPLPEVQQVLGRPGKRLTEADYRCLDAAVSSIAALAGGRWATPLGYWLPSPMKLPSNTTELLKQSLAGCDWIADAIVPATSHSDGSRSTESLVAQNFYKGRSPDLLIIPKQWVTPDLLPDAVHGTPYWYDTNVPIIIWGAGVKPGRRTETVQTVGIAPLLAEVAALPPMNTDASDETLHALRQAFSGGAAK